VVESAADPAERGITSTMLLDALCLANPSFIASMVATCFGRLVGPASAPAGLDIGLLAASLAFLVPAGLILIAIGESRNSDAPAVAAVGIATVALAVLAYAFVGFGLQFGGLGLSSDLGGAESLRAEWSPLDLYLGPGWGIVGLDGFLLGDHLIDYEVLSVVFYQSALAATGLCIPMLALARRLSYPALLGVGLLFALLVYPIYGNWVWGGGFLSSLGRTVGVGHGMVDYAGSGTVHALGAFFALAALLASGAWKHNNDGPSGLPPARFPLFAVLGGFLVMVGWFGVLLGNPMVSEHVSYVRMLVTALVAASSGALASSLYAWLVAGSADLLMVARGLVAALVAISALCPFVSIWAAVAIGALAGLLVPLGLYFFGVRLNLESSGVAMAVHGLPALWGLLAVGLFADGSAGQGWNGVGAAQYMGVPGQGVSGLLVRSGLQPDWPGQMAAQMAGILALMGVALFLSWVILRGAKGLRQRGEVVRADLEDDGEVQTADRDVDNS
jgi:Amt family ammonium transporter